ncbi:hypothetical protein [Gottfriedia solisilvae]|uniref:hypothetical protein n=1 Tax=Gottfriedia solisilvae TaxID=1516104 RepID=UPI003D2EEBE3
MKKIKLLLIAIISTSLLLVIYNFLPGTIMYYTSLWEYKVRDFDIYKDDFQTLANLAYREYNKNQKKGYFLYIDEVFEISKLNLIDMTRDDSVIVMSEKERKSLETVVAEAFQEGDGGYLSLIKVHKNQVEFETENGLYSLVYRKDRNKPKYVNNEYRKGKFKLKKILDHWYHARFVED